MRQQAVSRKSPSRPRVLRCHLRHPCHSREYRPTDGTYGDDVATSPDVNRVRFSRFVERVLREARGRDMTDADIQKATGVGPSTFHRWRRGDYTKSPDLDRVTAFCSGLGVPARAALLALGVEDGRDETQPEPATEPDVQAILRQLADPNVSDERKQEIRTVLRMLARRPGSTTPQRQQ